MYRLKRTYQIITILEGGHTSTFLKRASSLNGAKRYATSISGYPCKVQVFGISNPHMPESKWVQELLATRTITQNDIDYGVSNEPAKWKTLTK